MSSALSKDASDTLQIEEGVRLAVQSFGMTDTGKVRETNQDQFRVERTSLDVGKTRQSHDESNLFVVADGMGGHAVGEEASALAVDAVESFLVETFKWFSKCKGPDQDQVLADFKAAVAEASTVCATS